MDPDDGILQSRRQVLNVSLENVYSESTASYEPTVPSSHIDHSSMRGDIPIGSIHIEAKASNSWGASSFESLCCSLVMSDSFITFGAVHEYRELVTLGESGELLSSSQLPGMVHKGEDSGPIHVVDPLFGLRFPHTHPKPVCIGKRPIRC